MTPDPQLTQRAEEWIDCSNLTPDENQIVNDAHFACSDAEPFEKCCARLRGEARLQAIASLTALLQRERLMGQIEELKDVEGVYRAGVSVTSYVSNRLTVLNSQLSRDGGETNEPRCL